jgi:hypothetical protein
MLHQLIYASRATRPMSAGDVEAILDVSRRKNALCGISGMLLYDEGSFLQVLEGDEPEVERVYGQLNKDRRHESVVLVHRGPIAQRGFSEWSMGAFELTAASRQLPGVSDFLRTGVSGLGASPVVASRVLQGFRDGQFRRHVR